MFRRTVSAIIIAMMLTSTLTLAFNILPAKAEGGTIYIRADGSIDPPTAPIHRDGSTYTLTGNVYVSDANDGIVVEKSHITINGAGYALNGSEPFAGIGRGITISHCDDVTIKNADIGAFQVGISIEYSSGNSISGNDIKCRYAIYVYYSSSNTIFGNNLMGNDQYNIYLVYSSDNIIDENNITITTDWGNAGILLYESSNNSITENSIMCLGGCGIDLIYSTDNTVYGNKIANSWTGIWIQALSDRNSVAGNIVTNSSRVGIWLFESSGNSIFHNRFMDNLNQAYADAYGNTWDDGYPSGGNYWSDYTDEDLNNDGIWDHPYVIDANNQDNYPLVNPSTPTSPWPMFRHDPTHTGSSTSKAPNTNQTLWNYTTNIIGVSSPAVANGRVFIGTEGDPYGNNGEVYALNESTGTLLWSYWMGSAVLSSPAVAGGRVFIGTRDYSVCALNESTGALLWFYTTLGMVYSSPAIADGKVFIGSYGDSGNPGGVYALNESTGACIWSYITGYSRHVYSSPAVADGKVFVGSYGIASGANFFALNESTGSLIWSYEGQNMMVASSPAVSNGRVFIGDYFGSVYALDESTGAYIWNHTVGPLVYSSSPAVVAGKVFIGSYGEPGGDKVYALDESTGAYIWSYTTGGAIESSPAVADGKVFIGSGDNKVYALNESTGAYIWSYTTGGPVKSSPAVADGKVFIGSGDGKVYGFGTLVPVGDDLSIIDVEPIQVILDAEALVANKSTAIRATISSTFSTRVWGEINVTYDFGGKWYLERGPYGNGIPIDPGLNTAYIPGGPFFNETGVIQQPVPKFLTLPFEDDGVQLQKSWKAHVDDGTYGIDYIKSTLDEKTTWQSFPVVAAADGWALRSVAPRRKDANGNWINNYGNFVLIRHVEKDQTGNEYFTLYAHLNSVAPEIPVQDRYSIDYNYDDNSNWTFVKRGEIIGESGDTGAEGTGIHLHFEMQKKGYCIYPYEEYRTNPYDIVGGRSYYPGYADYEGCGSNHVWTTDPPQLPPLWLEWTGTGFDDRIAARIDPSNKIAETDEANNEKVCAMKVAESDDLRILCVPIYFPALPQEPLNPQMQQEARFLQETYPVAEDKFRWTQTRPLAWPGSPPVPSDPEDETQQANLREWLYRYVAVPVSFMTIMLGYDRAVIVLHDMGQDWGGIAIGMLKSPENAFTVLVTEGAGEGVVAHEIGHTFYLWHPHDIGPPVYDAQRFRVEEQDYGDLVSTFMSYLPPPLWIDKGRYDSDPREWMQLTSSIGTWRWNLLDQLKSGTDPQIIALSGTIFSNHTAVADEPWYYVPEGFSDLASGSSGDYSIVLLNGSENILDQFGFNASFSYLQDVNGTLRTMETDAVPFMLRIPYIPGTRTIEIRNATEHVLLSREVSPNAPVVNVTSPNGGEVLRAGTNCTISWESSDVDGGNLTSFVEYSCDGGKNWLPIAFGVTGNSHVWDTSGLTRGSSYLVRIVTSDGVNTCEDSSGSTFSVGVPDVAVTDVSSSRTIIGQGYDANISILAANEGDFTEILNVTFNANTTAIASQTLTLTSGNSTTINFTWNTTGFAKGNYTVWAYAEPVPGEAYTADNTFADGWIIVAMVGDITGPSGWPDGKCDMRDIGYVARRFMCKPGDPLWDPNADIDDNSKVDMKDIGTVARHFGETSP